MTMLYVLELLWCMELLPLERALEFNLMEQTLGFLSLERTQKCQCWSTIRLAQLSHLLTG